MGNVSECYSYPSNTTKYKNNLGMTARKKRSGYPFPLFGIGQEKCPMPKELHYYPSCKKQNDFQEAVFWYNSPHP